MTFMTFMTFMVAMNMMMVVSSFTGAALLDRFGLLRRAIARTIRWGVVVAARLQKALHVGRQHHHRKRMNQIRRCPAYALLFFGRREDLYARSLLMFPCETGCMKKVCFCYRDSDLKNAVQH
jgi:hypothetical protein